MTNDDIRDLLGRYATGSLTSEERARLFDAALDDQELFEELAREDEMKELFAGPGVRDRLIRALEPPKRRISWVWALAPVAVLSAVLFVVLTRPVPTPQQVAVATVSTPLAAPAEPAVSEPQPVAAPAPVKAPLKEKAVEQIRREAPELAKAEDAKAADAAPENAVKKDAESRTTERKEAAPKAMDQVAAAPPAPQKQADAVTVQVQAQASQVQGVPATQQNARGGPRQSAVQSARAFAPAGRAAGKVASSAEGFGFHYSVQTAGHLTVIPSADGYLAVKSGDGAALFASQRIAAGVVIDVVLPASVRSVSIRFSAAASPAPMTPAVRTAPEGDIQAAVGGSSAVAIEVTIKP
jgi:hypothetical protein